MKLSREQLRALAEARKRPACLRIAQLPDALVAGLLEFYWAHQDENILAEALANRDARQLSGADAAYLSAKYAQVPLQDLAPGAQADDRRAYTVARAPALMEQIEAIAGPCHRSRLSALAEHGRIEKHIDDPRQTRLISVLSGAHRFVLYGPEGPVEPEMKPGELWFVNTALDHEVENRNSLPRIALLLNVEKLTVEQC